MARPTIDEDEQKFLGSLEELGGAAGNITLRDALAWNEDRYWRTHTLLLDKGLIGRGRGKGGSVYIVEALPPIDAAGYRAADDTSAATSEPVFERSLYQPAKDVIKNGLAVERAFDHAIVEITAHGGAKSSGIWTNPDITLLATKAYPFLPGRIFDIITFELKKPDAIDVRGVFEALSHRQFASMSYVLFFTGGKKLTEENSDIPRIREVANSHGVGVYSADVIDDYKTWDELVEPKRNVYNPERANSFLSSLPEATIMEFLKWHK